MVRTLECDKCNRVVENVGDLAVKVTCSYCTMMMTGLPEETKRKASTGRPAGWHFMNEFVDKDGNVFYKGKEQPKLFGTLKPTKVKPTKKKTKRRTQEQILLAMDAERKTALKKAVKKQKDFINHNFGA